MQCKDWMCVRVVLVMTVHHHVHVSFQQGLPDIVCALVALIALMTINIKKRIEIERENRQRNHKETYTGTLHIFSTLFLARVRRIRSNIIWVLCWFLMCSYKTELNRTERQPEQSDEDDAWNGKEWSLQHFTSNVASLSHSFDWLGYAKCLVFYFSFFFIFYLVLGSVLFTFSSLAFIVFFSLLISRSPTSNLAGLQNKKSVRYNQIVYGL